HSALPGGLPRPRGVHLPRPRRRRGARSREGPRGVDPAGREARARASGSAPGSRLRGLHAPPGASIRPAREHAARRGRPRRGAGRARARPCAPPARPALPPAGALAGPRPGGVMPVAFMHRRRAPLGPYHRAILWLERRQLAPGGHRRVLAVSARVRDEVAGDYGVPRERIAVIYNGVDLERFHPAERALLGPAVRRELGVEDGTRRCVSIGTGFRRKGFDLLLGRWRTAPPPHAVLALVGGDERLGAFRREASRLAGRVAVTGPRDDVAALLAAADVVCVPSRQEAFGNVVLEACAAGVPVV